MSAQSLQCPQCNATVSVGVQYSGQRVACPRCGKQFVAPGSAQSGVNDDDDWLQLDDPEPPPAKPPRKDPAKPPKKDPAKPPTRNPAKAPTKTTRPVADPPAANVDEVTTLSDDDLLDEDDGELTLGPEAVRGGPSNAANGFSDHDLAALKSYGLQDDDFLESTDVVPGPTLGADISGSAADVPAFGSAPSQPDSPGPASPGSGSDLMAGDDDLFGDLPPVNPTTSASSGTAPATGQAAVPMDANREFRVKCPICGTVMYAKVKQAGKHIRCSDCHSQITVPQPPKVRPARPAPSADESYSFALETPQGENKPTDPYQKSANELLAQATADEEKEKKPKQNLDLDVPSIQRWLANVFGIFKDPGVILHWLILSGLLGGPAAFAYSQQSAPLFIGLMVWSVLFGILVISCGFAILQAVANQHETVSDWPTLDPPAWFEQLLVVVAAMATAAAPPWIACKLFNAPPMISLGFTMFCIYMAFPFLILSMLDMQSIFAPFSPEVARSTTQCSEAWGGLYFSAALLFGSVFFFALFAANSAGGVLTAVFLGVAATFVYFAMIGRLAYAIGQAVNAPTDGRENDSDELPARSDAPKSKPQ